jgi:tetratricopeptide (TPR) repeat protein
MATKAAATPKPTADTAARHGVPTKLPRTLAGQPLVDEAERKAMLGLYEKALKLVTAGKYEEAHVAFNTMLAKAPPDFAASIRTYIAVCVSQLDRGSTDFRTHEERYDYGISLLNHGNYEDAREVFKNLLIDNPDCDYAFYGMALLASMTSETEECLKHLADAIRLNPQYRLQARSDSDFNNVSDDPMFTELLYPDA